MISYRIYGINIDSELEFPHWPMRETYKGTVVSDNAAVYGKFSKAQKCRAHLLRKAIKLTLLDPKNKEYMDFADGAFQIFYDGRTVAQTKHPVEHAARPSFTASLNRSEHRFQSLRSGAYWMRYRVVNIEPRNNQRPGTSFAKRLDICSI